MDADLHHVVQTGDRLASLRAMRDHLAETAQIARPQYVAAIHKQLADVMAQIDALAPPAKAKTVTDEVAEARAKRAKGRKTPTDVSKRAAAVRNRRPRSGGTVRSRGADA